MKAVYLAAAAFVAGVAAQGKSQSKVNPPNHATPGPGYYIYQDVDYISTPNGNISACLSVQTLRSKCYSAGLKAKSLQAEWECLCAPDAAYTVTQCFAKNYQKLNQTAQDNYYEDFLDYTYDCYCGVTQYDVTYNRTTGQPFIAGFTGDCILPPANGCPAPKTPSNPPTPKPPCGCVPPPQPPKPPCPSGYHRVNECCVPNPPPCDECYAPKEIDSQGKCNCPWYLIPDGNSCRYPECPGYPLEVFVNGCYGGYCTCIGGYEYNSEGVCVKICGWGEISDGNGGCTSCPSPEIPDYNGQCVCPVDYGYTIINGECVLGCPVNEQFSYGGGGCYCPDGFYYDSNGDCEPALCDSWTPECYPGYPGIDNITNPVIVSYISSAPDPVSYTGTMEYNTSLYTATATAPPLTELPPPLVPTSVPSIQTTIDSGNATTTAPVGDSSTAVDTTTGSDSDTSTSLDTPTAGPDSSSDAGTPTTDSPSEPTSASEDSGTGGGGSGGGGGSSEGGGSSPTQGGSSGGDGGSSGGTGGDTGSSGGDTGGGTGGGTGGDSGAGSGGGGETATARVRRRGRWN